MITTTRVLDYFSTLVAEDDSLPLTEAALSLAQDAYPDLDLQGALAEIDELVVRLQRRMPADADIKQKVGILNRFFFRELGFGNNLNDFLDPDNSHLNVVLKRRRGIPISLAVLYLEMAEQIGVPVRGVAFPGHFLLRMELESERLILDPFKEGKEMNAADLRQLLKSIVGQNAELSVDYYNVVPNREILVRLENNLKKRLIEGEDYGQAILAAEAIGAFSPDEYRIYLDQGVLHAKLGHNQQAVAALETYIAKTPSAKERQQASQLLQQIKSELD